MEVMVLRDDYAKGVSPISLNSMIWKLARDYNMSPWLIRGLIEQRWETPT